MKDKAIQDHFSGDYAQCMGCGPEHPDGFHIKTYWDGSRGRYRFRPKPNQTAFPGVLYGGMIASIMDCHCIGTAIAAAYDREGRAPDTLPAIMYVTANLNVTYLAPTPMDGELELTSEIKEQGERKTVVTCRLCAVGTDKPFARGDVIAVRAAAK